VLVMKQIKVIGSCAGNFNMDLFEGKQIIFHR
jgi:hypothetical protein